MDKTKIIYAIIVVIAVTFFVYVYDYNSPDKKITFSLMTMSVANSNKAYSHRSIANLENSDISLKSDKVKVKNKDIETDVDDVNIDNSKTNVQNSKVNYNNRSYPTINSSYMFDNQRISTTSNYSGDNMAIDINDIDFSKVPKTIELTDEELKVVKDSGVVEDFNRITPQDMVKIQKVVNEFHNQKQQIQEEKERARELYEEKTIAVNWGVWRANVINRVVDESLKIHELDSYPINSSLYYRFNVDNTGRVFNVRVISTSISREDCDKLKSAIESLQYKNVLKFPKNSLRKQVSVASVMVLANETTYTNAQDFKDSETIKYKVKK